MVRHIPPSLDANLNHREFRTGDRGPCFRVHQEKAKSLTGLRPEDQQSPDLVKLQKRRFPKQNGGNRLEQAESSGPDRRRERP